MARHTFDYIKLLQTISQSVLPPGIEQLNLDPYEFRLYCHYLLACDDTGRCKESLGMTSATCQMSRNKTIEVRRTLIEKGLITIVIGEHRSGEPDTIVVPPTAYPPEFHAFEATEPEWAGGDC